MAEEKISTIKHTENSSGPDDVELQAEKIHDGDLALQVLHTHFEPYTPHEEKRLLRKIDLRLALLMLLVNGIQFIDKQTMAYAATYGLQKQAKLKGQEYSLLISIFYIGYLVAQYPTNVLMQRFPTGKYLTVNFILWGIVLTAMGACRSFGPFMACRFLLGVFEAPLNPGFILITSSWWKREEQPARIAVWYSANGLISIPSAFIFYGVAHMHVRGLFPYQWMFIFFGIFTVLFGTSLWWILPDSPVTASWLNDRERVIAVERLKSNKTGIKNTHHKWVQVKEALTDIKVWILVLGVFVHNMTNSLQSNFLGLIIKGFGYSTYDAILLSLPGSVLFALFILVISFFLSSRYGEGKRIFAMIFCWLFGVVSCAILYASPLNRHTKGLHLFACFIIGVVATSAGIMYSLVASNIAGYTKKTVAGAMYFIAFCVANIVTPQTFLTKEAPVYHTGIGVSLGAFCVDIALFALLYFVYRRENSKRDQMEEGQISQDETRDLIDAFSDLTDIENKKFRYKY